MDIVVVSLDDHNIVSVLRSVMVIVVVVVVAWIREGGWRTTIKSGMAVGSIDMNVRSRLMFSL
jgi:hypothetical protein